MGIVSGARPEAERKGYRRNAKISIAACPLLMAVGVVLMLTQRRVAAGIVPLAVGALGLLLWAFLWRVYVRRGWI